MESKPRILLVDDDPQVRKSLTTLLRRNQYHVETSANGKEAIHKLKTKFFDLTLLDIKLPDMEGTELLAKLHSIHPETIRIMITGNPSLDNAAESLNLGADAYLMKPIKPEQLLACIQEKLQKEREAEEITRGKVVDWVKVQVDKIQRNI